MTEREIGFNYIKQNIWNLALIHLQHAARIQLLNSPKNLLSDLELLDALGEAAYRNNVPEALGPYQNFYKYPSVAVHMARAFLMLGDLISCKEFLNIAIESGLKSAVFALSEMDNDIKKSARLMLPIAENFPELYYPEYWRALAAVADAVGNEPLTQMAERKSKHYAYKDPNIHFNQALRMLGKGEFRAGWRLYEWRLVPGGSQTNRTELGKIPIWEGEDLSGKSLLVFLEQGLGDCLFSLRYIQYFINLNIQIQIVARPSLIDLVKSSYPKVLVRNEDDVAEINYWENATDLPDFWTYSLSIPYKASLPEEKFSSAFMRCDEKFILKAKKIILKMNPENLPVYVVNWHGRIDTEADRTRAFSVKEFYQVIGLADIKCCIISVQKDITLTEHLEWQNLVKKNNSVFYSAADDIESFSDTAGFILNSDQLLTNDTSVAHLGGGLGHPTIVFARNKAIWQWLRTDYKNLNESKTEKAIWYDSVNVQYALTPEISWLFKTINKEGQQNHEDPVRQKKIWANGGQRKIRFAGRPNI